MMEFYVDTCIWIDFIEDRTDPRPLGLYAHRLFAYIKSGKHHICINEFLKEELCTHYSEKEIHTLWSLFRTKTRQISAEEKSEARTIAKTHHIPFGDALHAILARDEGAILITRDKHFKKILWCEPYTPEEIIS